MMRKGFLVLFILTHSIAFAQGEVENQPKTEIPKSKERPRRAQSSENRQNVKAFVAGHPIVVQRIPDPYSMVGLGTSAGTFLNPSLSVDAIFTFAGSGGGKFEAYHLLMTAKRYLGNSFFVEAGAGFQNKVHNFKYDKTSSFSFDTDFVGPHIIVSTRTAGLVAGIGSRWQWAAFLLGVDWITAYIPTTIGMSQKITLGDELGSWDPKVLARNDRKYAGQITFTFPQIALGAAF